MYSAATKPTQFPEGFAVRYVLGQVLSLLPVLAVLAAYWVIAKPSVAAQSLGMILLILVGLAFLSRYRAMSFVPQMEKLWQQGIDVAPLLSSRENLRPLIYAMATMAVLLSLVRRDIRWALVVAAIGVLLAIGLGLRWLVFDRWFCSTLK